jgi:hypothetical protein
MELSMTAIESRKKHFDSLYAVYDLMTNKMNDLLSNLPEWGKKCMCTTDRLITDKIHANIDDTSKLCTFCLECGGYISEFSPW